MITFSEELRLWTGKGVQKPIFKLSLIQRRHFKPSVIDQAVAAAHRELSDRHLEREEEEEEEEVRSLFLLRKED
jgi:hypothetical protein